ncbi:MAG TPA: hypothetical protein DCZ03_02955, partial [Gammaproteobacteria bacterium]|nr:hypothetical protein [Gammaproteobacteria bacterium]
MAGCDLEYGTTEQKKALDQIMYQGKHEEISSHLSAAQSTRGLALGCPTSSYNHTEPDLTPPTATELENYWRTHFEPILREYQLDCPVYGRLWSAGAWAAYRLADYGIDPDFAALARIGRMQTDTQYQGPVENVEHGPWTGAFGFLYTERRYLFSSYCANTWRALDPDNVIGRLHRELPELFVTYEQDGRTYGGRQFLVGDMLAPEGFYDGGLAYDHGWSAAALLMAAAAPHANADTSRFRHAAILAADWAGREPMSRNHNYTAKLIWFLAEMYRDTGETRYREAMMQKLQLNLLPGILLDQNNDGRVDAVQGAFSLPRFNQLSPVAQVPGRMWDGHNSLPQYQAMNSWAVVAAYVALREHQDEFANNLRPIMRQMLDNMSHEILNLGVPEPGRTQMPIALGLALVDVIAEEPVTRDNRYPQWRTWRDALWAIWNRTHSDPLPFPEALTFAPGVAMTLIASQLFADEAPEPPTAQLDETFDSELLTNWYALDLGRFGGPSDWHTGEGLLKQTSRIRS